MSLESLKPILKAMKPADVRPPHLPMPNALQEAHDLLTLCRSASVHEALVAVGHPADFDADLQRRIEAAREGQSIWVSVRDQTKSTSLVELEARAVELRSDLLAAARWNLRKDREAQVTLSSIRGGDAVADLVQDLFDLATLVEKHADAFETDQSFDAAAQAVEARDVGRKLSGGISDERLDPEPAGTRDLRDRAFTFLDDLVSELRSAGRYAFRKEPSIAKRFASRYRRRLRRGSKGAEPATDVVEEEVVGEEVVVTDGAAA